MINNAEAHLLIWILVYVAKDWLLGSTTIVIDSSAKQTTIKQLDADQERKEAESMIENEEKEDICQD